MYQDLNPRPLYIARALHVSRGKACAKVYQRPKFGVATSKTHKTGGS